MAVSRPLMETKTAKGPKISSLYSPESGPQFTDESPQRKKPSAQQHKCIAYDYADD